MLVHSIQRERAPSEGGGLLRCSRAGEEGSTDLFSPLPSCRVAYAVVLAGDKARVAPVKATLVSDRPRGNNWRGQRIEMTESDLDEVAFLTGSWVCFD